MIFTNELLDRRDLLGRCGMGMASLGLIDDTGAAETLGKSSEEFLLDYLPGGDEPDTIL